MSKMLRKEMARELSRYLEEVDSFILVDYSGLEAQDAFELRSNLYAQGISLFVLKNTLANVVLKQKFPGNSETIAEHLNGPTAIAFGGESIVNVAQCLVDWNKKAKKIKLKAGYLPGNVLSNEDVVELSKTPPREVLLSMLAGVFEAPMQQIATILAGPLQNVVYATNGLIDKMEEQGAENVSDLTS